MQRRRCRSARADALLPLALFALLVGQVQLAEAQRPPSNAGDAPVVPRSSAIQGRDAGAAQGGDQDPRLLIAHGLEMAIEGSMLQGLAMQPGLAAGANVSPASAAPRPGAAGTPGVNSSGLGFTGAPGETVSGRPVTTPATGTGVQTSGSTGTGPTRLGNIGSGAGAGVAGNNGVTPNDAASTMSGGSPAAMLQQHADRAFQASNDLLGQANPGAGPDQNFSEAARIYAATLKSLGGRPTAPSSTRAAGLPESRPIGSAAPAVIGPTELASIALVNHGVKEAIGSLKIKQVARSMGSSGGPVGQKLVSHARRMDEESRSVIQSINAGAAPGGVVQTLAQQANQLIMAMQALNADPGR